MPLVFIDGCAINRFALLNLDPTPALAGSPFRLAITPDLEAEYKRALDHLFVPSYVKTLVQNLLDRAEPHANPSDEGGADAGLMALALTQIVVTDDAKQYRRWSESRPGLVPWPEIEAHWRDGGGLIELLAERAARLPHSR